MDELRRLKINARLVRPLLGHLATASPETLQPHVVPVWYWWDGEAAWISTFRSTRKVRELQKNPNCALVVDVSEDGETWGVLLEGRAELVTGPQDILRRTTATIYARYLGPEGVLDPEPQSWIENPENLLIKLAPAHISVW